MTRRVLRVEQVPSSKSRDAFLRACILHQRKRRDGKRWWDAPAFDLRTLNAGQEIRLQLKSAETLNLYRALKHFFGETDDISEIIKAHGTTKDSGEIREAITFLLQNDGEHLLQYIAQSQPQLLQTRAYLELQETRRGVVEEFRRHLHERDWTEHEWQHFFEANVWIFGHNLAYQFLDPVDERPGTVGAANLHGYGEQIVDMLMSTSAQARFTVLVDIKRPDSRLLRNSSYRQRVPSISRDLMGAFPSCSRTAINGKLKVHGYSTTPANSPNLRYTHFSLKGS